MTPITTLTAQWTESFKSSEWLHERGGKIRFNYFKARSLYYGAVTNGKTDQGFQKCYMASVGGGPERKADAILRALEILGTMGIHVPLDGRVTGQADRFLEVANNIFLYLSHPKNQYAFDLADPLGKVTADLEVLAAIISGSEEIIVKPKEKEGNFNQYVHIPDGYLNDPFIRDLYHRITHTKENFFITGKAGTGKSTFLHYLAQNSPKNIVIAAYTGIAAINVGGTTLNSLFMLPFRPLLPRDEEISRFGKWNPRRTIISKMDTLVIDEVSMVRADILEAVDHSLRINGGDPFKPFGGKQIILIGDVFQLPPVVKSDDRTEWEIFEEVYKTPYFFSAPSFRLTKFNFVEFTKIYRQSDEEFKDILNKIRIGDIDQDDLAPINKRVYPNYEPREQDFVLTLVTTNRLAGDLNDRRLKEIDKPEFEYKATITGEFSKDKWPTDEVLKFKEGAQIIFIRNDSTSESTVKDNSKRRWVNGTIAKIHALCEDEIEVLFENGTVSKVTKEKWENKRYVWNKRERKIVTESVGTFEQFPLRLAWAITIHKSQGLTFEKMVLNMGGGAFAHGQTYVALSRCKALTGLALKKPVTVSDIIIDDRVLDFYHKHFTFNEAYKESQQNLEFILEHSDFFLGLLSVHYFFTVEQWDKYRAHLLPDYARRGPDKEGKVYSKMSFGEIKECIKNEGVMFNLSFWQNNFEEFFSASIVETILDYLLELDKVMMGEEEEEE